MSPNNNVNNPSINYDALPKNFFNYINFELSFFEKITSKKFFFTILNNDRFELNVYDSKEGSNDNNSKYHLIYGANNLNQFIKNLFMIREYLIKNWVIK
jgi:hypothetical protein